MVENLKHTLQSLAIADAIIEPEWQYRYFSYDSNWAEDEEMASMRDGEGGDWFVLFKRNMIGYKCISPEDGLINNLDEVKQQIPSDYHDFVNEPAFYADHATSIWILKNGAWLKFGKQSVKWIIDLDEINTWGVNGYKAWAEEYYERELDSRALISVFEHKISDHVVQQLNSNITMDALQKDLRDIGINPKPWKVYKY